MPQIPHRLQPDTSLEDNLALINDNTDKTAQDMADFGAKFSTTANLTVPLTASSFAWYTLNFIDSTKTYRPGYTQVIPRFRVYVDTNNDNNYWAPGGASLTLAQNSYRLVWYDDYQYDGTVANAVGRANLQVSNIDTVSSHTYYITIDLSYINSPATGVFR